VFLLLIVTAELFHIMVGMNIREIVTTVRNSRLISVAAALPPPCGSCSVQGPLKAKQQKIALAKIG